MVPEETNGYFTYSLANHIRHDAQGPRHICGEHGGIISLSTGPRLAEARNQIVDIYASQHTAEWLLMVDSDMVFGPTLVEDLLSVADPEKVPILSGLAFAGGRSADPYPAVYRGVEAEANGMRYVSVERAYDYPRDALVQVQATGGACLLMHRGALGAIGKANEHLPDGRANPYRWFVEGSVGPGGEEWGEDIAFGLRANALGIPVHVHTGIKLGHRKAQTIDEAYYDAYRATPGAAERSNGHRAPAEVKV
jgi:hypothetical protein